MLPAGRYAVLIYKGAANGIAANKQLIDGIAEQDEEIVAHPSENGDAYKARYETYLTKAEAEPDQDKWEIEVAIKLRD